MTKRLIILFTILPILAVAGFAQDKNSSLLPVPEDWRFEKIDFPLDFAPDLDYQGFEELRFAPQKSPKHLSTNNLRTGSMAYIDDRIAYHQVGNPYRFSAISIHAYLK